MTTDPRTMPPEELVELSHQLHARCCAWDVTKDLHTHANELRAEILRRLQFVPPASTEIQDILLSRKECCYLLRIRRETLWKMQRRGLVFIRGEIRLSALADFLGADIARRRKSAHANVGHERARGTTGVQSQADDHAA